MAKNVRRMIEAMRNLSPLARAGTRHGRSPRRATAILGIALAAWLACGAPASRADGEFAAPEQLEVGGEVLVRNGVGVREASRFLITAEIYRAALYLRERSSDARSILGSPSTKLIRMQYSYKFTRDEMQRGWAYAFTQNCGNRDCAAFAEEIAAFQALVVEVEPGDRYEYLFFRDHVDILRDDLKQGAVSGRGFVELLLSTWIGEEPPTPELRRGLLGK